MLWLSRELELPIGVVVTLEWKMWFVCVDKGVLGVRDKVVLEGSWCRRDMRRYEMPDTLVFAQCARTGGWWRCFCISIMCACGLPDCLVEDLVRGCDAVEWSCCMPVYVPVRLLEGHEKDVTCWTIVYSLFSL
jgi:hypothetical protein